jgi:hypothetical protein
MPATVADAYHLLRQALTRPDPVWCSRRRGALFSDEVDCRSFARGKAVARRIKMISISTYRGRSIMRWWLPRWRRENRGDRTTCTLNLRFRHGADMSNG